jgi:hypothetical protein
MNEQKRTVIVEAVGTIHWLHSESADPRCDESEPVARVRDEEGGRYIVTGRECFRNGTTINESIVGLTGQIEVYRFAAISFNCPTMFGKRGL